jgi:ubiquinone/menaquinone biosynthesis C-methylase UbiE
MDYDTSAIATTYDRAREHPPEVLLQWMSLISRSIGARPAKKIVDLGCGTGRFSYALATHFQGDVVGIDPSLQMLAHARAKAADGLVGGVRFELMPADQIPLPRGSVDLIFMSQVFHHLNSPKAVASCCHDVLADSGAVFVRNATVENIPSIRYVDFFPGSGPLLQEILPSREHVQVAFQSSGFRLLSQGSLDQELATDHAVYAEKLSLRADSILASLSRRDFEQGMTNLRQYAKMTGRSERVCETIDFFLFAKSAA